MRKLIVILLATLSFSCSKDLEQGEDSLMGAWDVVFAETVPINFGNRLPADQGNLGTFTFRDDVMDYFFVHNQDTIMGSTPWLLTLDKERQGFYRTNSFTLKLESFLDFKVNFEDQTRNAEKDAREIELIEDVGLNPNVDYLILKLNKQ